MNKFFISFVFIMLLLSSCKDENMITDVLESENPENCNLYERLTFNSSRDLFDAIEKGESGDVLTRSNNFISLLSQCALTRGDGETVSNYYEALGYDSLVPNLNFARLLNPEGECIVNDTVYKINSNGTYFYHKNMDAVFREIVQKDSLGTLMEGDLYCLASGIYRYDTFKETFVEEIESFDGLSDDCWDDEMGNIIDTRSYIPEPNWNSFPTFSADRHTFFGKLWQGLVGNDKYCSVKLSKKRKIRGRLYAYHYVAYSESGVSGMMEKKNWIGWSKTSADELRVGWKNIVLTVDVKDYSLDGMPKPTNELNGAGIHNMRLPNGAVEKVLILYNRDLKPSACERYGAMGVSALIKQAKRWLGSNYTTRWDEIKNIVIATRGKIYIVESDEMRRAFNAKSMTHVIAKRYNIMITLNFSQLPSNFLGWMSTLKGTLEQEYPKLISGEAYICGRLGNTWQGMKIKK